MSNFWPDGIEISDIQSPKEILELARQEWEAGSKGVLKLIFRMTKSTDNFEMIIVDANHVPSKRTATLFEVVHRPSAHYPVRIQVKDTNLPNYLKKSYYQSGIIDDRLALIGKGYEVSNPWVSDTPSEFREKLREAFNLGSIKNDILNLLSTPPAGTEDDKPTPEAGEQKAAESGL